ncbi:MAG: DMT family transporter [Hyphomicrobiales bacterium]|nr:DMT family transporter [Hyphomicrobiales bacterium]
MPPIPHSPLAERRAADFGELAVLVVVWGASFALTKIAVGSVPPTWVVALRITIAAVIIVSLLYARGGRLSTDPRQWLWFLWLGLVGSILPFLLISWGSQFIPSAIAGILMAAVPFAVLVLAHFALPDEPMTFGRVLGFVLGFIGVVVLIDPTALLELGGNGMETIGQLAVLCATFCYAINSVSARLAPAMDSLTKSAGVLAAAAPITLAIAFVDAPTALVSADPAAIGACAALGLFPTALATIVLFRLLQRAGAGFVAMSNYLVPAFAVLLGAIALGEHLHWLDYAGFALLLTGLAFSEWARKRF